MLKKYSLYFKIANYLILIHAVGHYFGHQATFVDYQSSSSNELIALFESMQLSQTSGGNGIWVLFLMFSASYTIFQVMIAVINLVLIYSKGIPFNIMKRIVLVNLILWISSLFLLFLTNSAIGITLISQGIFFFFNLIAYLLLRNNPEIQ